MGDAVVSSFNTTASSSSTPASACYSDCAGFATSEAKCYWPQAAQVQFVRGHVGGCSAPCLCADAFRYVVIWMVCRRWGVADPTTLVVVGAAAVLGAACRAPLTAFGLMVEITRCAYVLRRHWLSLLAVIRLKALH
jgi:hypothetical protein